MGEAISQESARSKLLDRSKSNMAQVVTIRAPGGVQNLSRSLLGFRLLLMVNLQLLFFFFS
jgi:hypothetical protein